MQPLVIKGMELGVGAPKIIISLMGKDLESTLDQLEKGKAAGVDCFEWRADFSDFAHDRFALAEQAPALAKACKDHPLLFTFRSESQGGQLTLSVDEYVELNKAIIETECVDLVDIETWIGDDAVKVLVAAAKDHGVAPVISYHNFKGTPSTEWMVQLLTHMADLGAAIPKIAVMAKEPQDTLRLLAATEEVSRLHFDGPLLTMAMGGAGALSRLTGEAFGSALTFCALGKASAPGQVDVEQARTIMNALHEVFSVK